MADAKVTVGLFPEDPDSARKCHACGHEQPHNRGEYEDTHSRCVERYRKFAPCDRHRKRYSQRCEDRGQSLGCYSYYETCDCSSEDRVIAELRAYIRDADKILGQRCACGHFEVEHMDKGHSTRRYCRRTCACEVFTPVAGGPET